jgi:lysophospholipase L1-like esterase
MVSLADELNVACWDLYGVLGGAHSIERLQDVGFAASDHLHFNRTGYELIGELLYDTLVRAALDNRMAP